MKAEEMRDLSDVQLQQTLDDSYKALQKLRFELATRQNKHTHLVSELKTDIARIKTVLRERELMRVYGGEDFVEVEQQQAVREETPRRRGLFGRK